MGEPAAGIPRYTGHMNEPAAKPATKPRGLRRRHVLVGVGAAAGGLAITKALGLYNLPSQSPPALAGADDATQDKPIKPQELIGWWLDWMLRTPTPFAERMTFFWHGHFT